MAIINLGAIKKGFPSLFGEGADLITGGRNQTPFFITNLNTTSDSTYFPATANYEAHYRGSFTGAWSAGNRNIIPYIGGNYQGSTSQNGQQINFDGGFGNPDVNISYHGHLAPSGGLAITNSYMTISRAANIIMRYASFAVHNNVTTGTNGQPSGPDNLFFNRCHKVALDHSSFRFNGDEACSFGVGSEGATFDSIITQRNIFGEGHPTHNRGMILGSTSNGTTSNIKATLHNNLWITFARTPNISGSVSSPNTYVRTSNGVVYNWVGRTMNLLGSPNVDEINKYYVAGPNTIPLDVSMFNQFQSIYGGPPSIYTAGNIVDGYFTNPYADNRFALWSEFDNNNSNTLPPSYFRVSPLPVDSDVGYNPKSAIEGYNSVILDQEVGSNRSTDQNGNTVFYHDSIDQNYINSVKNKTNPNTPLANWAHPSRPTNTVHQADTTWNGIYDGFQSENNINLASDVKSSYTWKGDTYLNPANYNSFEVWSAIAGGAKELITGTAVGLYSWSSGAISKKAKLTAI